MLTKSQSTAIEQIKEFIKNDMTVHCLSGSPGTGIHLVQVNHI